LDMDEVITTLSEYFQLASVDYKLIDREVGFVVEDEGNLEF